MQPARPNRNGRPISTAFRFQYRQEYRHIAKGLANVFRQSSADQALSAAGLPAPESAVGLGNLRGGDVAQADVTQASLLFEFSQRLDLARNRAFGRGVHRADDAQIDHLHRLETKTLQIALDADLVRTIHGFDALLALTGSTASANL
jgi:hypothetical protein